MTTAHISVLDQSLRQTVSSKTGNYTVLLSDRGRAITVDASGGNRTIILPPVASAGSGFPILIQKSDTSTNRVIIDPNGSELINGQLTFTLRLPRQTISIISDGAEWRILSGNEIFETATTPTGTYIKWANGWMDIYHKINTNLSTEFANGSIFISGVTPNLNFPVPFIEIPYVFHTGKNGGGSGWSQAVDAETTTSWGRYRTASGMSDSSTSGVINLHAAGRWV